MKKNESSWLLHRSIIIICQQLESKSSRQRPKQSCIKSCLLQIIVKTQTPFLTNDDIESGDLYSLSTTNNSIQTFCGKFYSFYNLLTKDIENVSLLTLIQFFGVRPDPRRRKMAASLQPLFAKQCFYT